MKNAHSFRSDWAKTIHYSAVLQPSVVAQKTMSELLRIIIDERLGHSAVKKKSKLQKQAAPTPVFTLECPH